MVCFEPFGCMFLHWPDLDPKPLQRLIQGKYIGKDSEVVHIKAQPFLRNQPAGWNGEEPEFITRSYPYGPTSLARSSSHEDRQIISGVIAEPGGTVMYNGVNFPAWNVTAVASDELWSVTYKSVGSIIAPTKFDADSLRLFVQGLKPPSYHVTSRSLIRVCEEEYPPFDEDVVTAAGTFQCRAEIIDDMIFEAANALRFNSNNLENISELISTVKGLKDPIRLLKRMIPKNPKDAWLSYRYQYTTTKSDCLEAARLAKTIHDDNSGVIRTGRVADGIACHLLFRYWPYENQFMQFAQNLTAAPYKLGLQLSLKNVWDLIPFSFVADWFTPIGDYLTKLDNVDWLRTFPYDYTCLISFKGSMVIKDHTYQVYRRVFVSPSMDYTYFEGDSTTSGKTWGKRALDVWALKK